MRIPLLIEGAEQQGVYPVTQLCWEIHEAEGLCMVASRGHDVGRRGSADGCDIER
jgi:hypothetical protein